MNADMAAIRDRQKRVLGCWRDARRSTVVREDLKEHLVGAGPEPFAVDFEVPRQLVRPALLMAERYQTDEHTSVADRWRPTTRPM